MFLKGGMQTESNDSLFPVASILISEISPWCLGLRLSDLSVTYPWDPRKAESRKLANLNSLLCKQAFLTFL